MDHKVVVKVIDKKLKQLKRERDNSDGGDYYRNYQLLEMKIKVVEEIKREIEKLEEKLNESR